MSSDLRRFSARVDWVEPLDAYRLLRDQGALLLDGMGAHPEARTAVVAFSPHLEARVWGRRLEVHHEDGSVETRDDDPVDGLRRLTDTYRSDVEESGFTGGFVGYFGYGFARAVEPTLPAPEQAPGTPDAVLRLCRDAVVFDRAARTVTVWTTDLGGESGAQDRLGRWRERLTDAPPSAPTVSGPVDADWVPSLSRDRFQVAVERLREHIRTGGLFQANLAVRFQTPLDADPVALFAAMQAGNPSPYMALLEFDDHAVVSNSPEQLFAVEAGILRSRPIAGTRPRGRTGSQDDTLEQELLADPKERAEHTMLVDLVRNDVAKVSRPGTVRVAERMSVERYSHVMHLVSRVEGRIRDGSGFVDWLAALFPGGTITGAPKHRACLRIHGEEPVPRGPYTGSAGYLSWSHNTHWNILIRTLVLQDGVASVHAGSGIVMDSDPEREWHEAGRKAQALLEAATGGRSAGGSDDRTRSPSGTSSGARPGGSDQRLGEVTRHGDWAPPKAPRTVQGRRLLVVDNYDSFVWNLADYAASLGAKVRVVRNDVEWQEVLADFDPTHILVGPGPGWPGDAGCSKDLVRAVHGRLPVLGVCLGHQTIAEAFGGVVEVHREAVHGKTGAVHHDGTGLFHGIPSPLTATRYHSLVVRPGSMTPEWIEDAHLADGTLMAFRHREHPTFGVQFHPESLCTDRGLEIVLRFLETHRGA